MRLLAIVARIARPSAPPTCWAVLIRPEARPASSGGAGHGGDRHRHEGEAEADRGEQRRASTSPMNEPPGPCTRENQNRPAATNSRPAISDRLEADAGDGWEATPAETMMPTASGR